MSPSRSCSMNQSAPCHQPMCRSLIRNEATTIRTRLCIQPSAQELTHPGVDQRDTRSGPACQAFSRSAAVVVWSGSSDGHLLVLRLHRLGRRVRPVPQHVGEEVPPGDLPGQGAGAVGPLLGQVVQHRTGMQVTPAQGDRQMRGGVGSGEVVQLLVVGDPAAVPRAATPCHAAGAGRSPASSIRSSSAGGRSIRFSAASQSTLDAPHRRGRLVHAVVQPGPVERAEDLERSRRTCCSSVPGRDRVRGPGRGPAPARLGQGLGDPLVTAPPVRAEVGGDVDPGGVDLPARPAAPTFAGLPRTTLRPGPAPARAGRRPGRAARPSARRAAPFRRSGSRAGSSTNSGSTRSPSSSAARRAGLSASRKSRRTHQIGSAASWTHVLILHGSRRARGADLGMRAAGAVRREK